MMGCASSHISKKAKYGSGQTAEFDENVRDLNPAETGSVGPVEDESEDFSKMDRGQDVITV